MSKMEWVRAQLDKFDEDTWKAKAEAAPKDQVLKDHPPSPQLSFSDVGQGFGFGSSSDELKLVAGGIGIDSWIAGDTANVSDTFGYPNESTFYPAYPYIGDPLPTIERDPYQHQIPLDFTANGTSTTFNFIQPGVVAPKYSAVFELPIAEMPSKVFINGRLVSLGVLGDDVIAAWDKDDKLVIESTELTTMYINDRIEVSLEYSDCMFHYNVEHTSGIMAREEGSNMIEAILVSEIAQ